LQSNAEALQWGGSIKDKTMFQWLARLMSPTPAATPDPAAPARAQPAPAAAPATTAAPQAAATAAPAPAAASAPVSIPTPSFEQKDNINANFFDWLFNTSEKEDTGLDTNEQETAVLAAVSEILSSQQSGAALVRRLPGVIPQLLQSLRSDSFSGTQLSRTISNDIVLVAAVVRLANSSLAGSGKSISSVENAVMVIGQEGLRQLITGVAFRPIIDIKSGTFTRALAPRIWDQSERCAVACRTLAASAGLDPFEAFLAGLVQHVGLIVTLRIMDQNAKDESQLGSALFCSSLLRDARTLSINIGKEWNFPPQVTLAISEQGATRRGAPMSPLGQLLAMSDYLSKVRILVEHQRLAEGDPRLFKGLGEAAFACYQGLDAIDDELAGG
jgi:HD-like signal output (HDOD) protein